MSTSDFRIRPLVFGGVTLATVLWLTLATSRAQQEEVVKAGRPAYEQHCAVCHGLEGKGDGGAATLLTLKPPDLTQLSKNNNGVFPFWRVYGIIDGRQEVKGHGTREMPLWGAEFRAEAGTNLVAQSQVRGRILELVYYLESIQAK